MSRRSPWREMTPGEWDTAAGNFRATRNDTLQGTTPAVEAPTAVDAAGIELAAAGASGRGSRRSGGPERPQTAVGALWRVLAALAVGLLVVGCAPAPGQVLTDGIRVWHDDARNVTCWTRTEGNAVAISCLPDSEVGK